MGTRKLLKGVNRLYQDTRFDAFALLQCWDIFFPDERSTQRDKNESLPVTAAKMASYPSTPWVIAKENTYDTK